MINALFSGSNMQALPNQRIAIYGYFLVFAFLCLQIFNLFPFQIDDAYITYHYAQNFIESGVFTFNKGMANVEGFTSTAWFWLCVFFGTLFGVENIHWTGIILGLLSFLLLNVLAFYQAPDRLTGCLYSLALSALPGVAFYSVTGMEALFYVLLVATFALALCQRIPFALGLIAALVAPWVRPETPWFFVMMLIAFLMADDKKTIFQQSLRYVLALCISFGLLLVFRWHVFHDVLPNTYYEKQTNIVIGLLYLKDFLRAVYTWPLLLLAAFSFYTGNVKNRTLFLMAASWVIVAVIEGGDWMNHYRFLLPAAVLWIFSLDFKGIFYTQARLTRLIVSFLLVCFFAISVQVMAYQKAVTHQQLSTINAEDTWLINWIKDSNINSVAAVDIGRLAYSSGVEVLDLGGLTDRYISMLDGRHLTKKIPYDYIADRAPDIFVLRLRERPEAGKITPALIRADVETHVFLNPRFHQAYRLLFLLGPSYDRKPYYVRLIFVKREIADTVHVDSSQLHVEDGLRYMDISASRPLSR